MPDYSPAEVEYTHRCRELERELGREPSARVTYRAHEHLYRRWRIEQDMTFARLDENGHPTPDAGDKATALIAEGATPVEVLEVFHRFMHDPNSHKFFHDRAKAGLPLDEQPYPLSAAERNEREKLRAFAKRAKEVAEEGLRKHLHNQLAHFGLLDQVKGYHKRTGRLRMLFDKARTS